MKIGERDRRFVPWEIMIKAMNVGTDSPRTCLLYTYDAADE